MRLNSLSARALLTATASLLLPALSHAAIYVASSGGFGGPVGFVGSYNNDGSPINTSLITGLSGPFGIAVSGSNLYVSNDDTGIVGLYNTDGTAINASLITGIGGPTGLLATPSLLYVSSQGDGTVKLYSASGTLLNDIFISGLNGPSQIATDGALLYVVNVGDGSIGQYTLTGTPINTSLVAGISNISGVAVSPDGLDLYVSSQLGTIGEYSALTGAPINASLITGGTYQNLALAGSTLFEADYAGNVSQYALDGTPLSAPLFSVDSPLAIAVTVPEPTSCFLLLTTALLPLRRTRKSAR